MCTLRTVHTTRSVISLLIRSVHNVSAFSPTELAVSQRSTGPGRPRMSRRYASLLTRGGLLMNCKGGQNLLGYIHKRNLRDTLPRNKGAKGNLTQDVVSSVKRKIQNEDEFGLTQFWP